MITSEWATRTKPLEQPTLRVDKPKVWIADMVWVTEKGDSWTPFTQDDAGGTSASQLL